MQSMPDEFRIDLFTNLDMLLMVEKGIRDGITQAVKRNARAKKST